MSIVDVDEEILNKLSLPQIYEWMAVESLWPFGDRRQDLRSAREIAHLVSVNSPKGRSVAVADFLIQDENPWEETLMSQEEIEDRAFAQLRSLYGKKK